MPKTIRWVFASDNHGDLMDPGCAKALRELCRFFRPEVRIHGGDAFNFKCLRRGAGSEEALDDLRADLDAGMDFLRWFKPQHWLRGNHDERLVDGINSHNPVLARFASMAYTEIVEAAGSAKIYPYCKRRGILKLGTLAFTHGFATGIYAAKKMAEVYNNVVFGHVHFVDAFSIAGLEPRVGRAVGCMCALDQDYNRAQLNTLRQTHGFSYGFVFPNGMHQVYQATPIDGIWRFPSEFREVKHEG